MISPNWIKALQNYLKNDTELKSLWVNRVWFLKVENGVWPAIVFNEWSWEAMEWANIDYEKWIDIFPILIDVVVKYSDSKKWYDIRNIIRKKIWKFDWKLTNDWEWMIVFRQVLAPSYNHDTDNVVFGSVYLLKQNFDYTPLTDNNINNANDTSEELTEQSSSSNQ